MSGANVKTFSAANWEQDVIGSETPVLVDFGLPGVVPAGWWLRC